MRKPPPRSIAWIVAAVAGFAPTVAQAHLVATGMGPIYDGISHFALSPEDFLPAIALAFFAGLRGPSHARAALAALPFAMFAGGVAALLGLALPPLVLPVSTALLFLIVGGLLAADANVPPAVCAVLAVPLGAVRGLDDVAGVPASVAHILSLLGMCASVFVVVALAASVTLPLQRAWMIVAARVSGSWLAALGLLLTGWIIRYGALVR
jgi:hypothetical protein